MKKRMLGIIKDILFILFGNYLFAFVAYTLISPSGIVVGGITGIGITLERALGIRAEWFVLPANISILIFGWIVLGKKMVVTSIASSVLYPVFFGIQRYIPFIQDITKDILLASILSGAGVGAAVGILMRVGASTGGTDIICLSLHKWFHLPVSVFVLIVDFVVIFGQAFVSGLEMVLYGLIYTAVETIVLNKVMLLGQSQIQVTVISDKYQAIRFSILNEMHCGVTMLHIETGCRGEAQMGILCVVHPRQLFDLQKKLLAIDPEAFITVTQIKEVRGQGFTSEKRDMVPISETSRTFKNQGA